MKHNVIETVMGFVVLTVAGFFLSFAYYSSKIDTTDGYHLTAKFSRVDGVQVGSDIKLSGVNIGKVNDIILDPNSYQAVVSLDIDKQIKLPKDSSAEVISGGLLGAKYIAIVPGGDEEYLTHGQEISYTQASVSLEAMIGQVIFNKKDSKDEQKK